MLNNRAEEYAIDFFTNYFRDDKEGVPTWIKEALAECNISLPETYKPDDGPSDAAK